MISIDFSLAVVSSIFFALCFAAPLQNIGIDISYEKDPPGRGTITILWSCVFTFALCTWTSVHPNILPPGSTSIGRLKYKLLWMSFAMLFPHGIMLCAFGQWREAKRLHKFWLERFEINVKNQYDHMGIEGGFFLLMGGFTLPKGEGEEDGYIPVLTPYGFVTYVQAGMIDQSSFDRRFINDKGKASSVAKLVTLVQAGWLIFQCITRVVAGLPITLLEIHVANQVFCAAVSYFFWWHKPLDVNEPMEIGLKTGAVPRPLPAEQRQQLKQPELVRRENVYYSQSGYEITEKSRSGLLVLMLRVMYDISEFLFGNDTQAKLAISNNVLRNSEQGWEVGRSTNKSLIHKTVAENEIRMGDAASHSNESASIDIYRVAPSTRNPIYTFLNFKDISTRSMNTNTTLRISTSSNNSDTSIPRNPLDKLVVGIFLISGGGFHLAAWNVPFPTKLEWLLWIISCMGICLGSLFLTAIFLLTDWEKQYLRALWETRFYDHDLLGHMWARLLKESRVNASLWRWMNIYIAWFLVFLYVLLSIFITAESFLHLRRLSAMFYQTPVWDGYWPHISG